MVQPKNYWKSELNHRAFVRKLEEKLNITSWKDWYRVTQKDIHDEGGRSLLTVFYNGSPSRLITTIYPDHPWNLHDFRMAPKNYWSVESNQKELMSRLEKKLNIKNWKDWYQVSAKDIHREGGGVLLTKMFDSSRSKLLMTVYPQHPWNIHDFTSLPKNYWNKEPNRSDFMKNLEEKLNIVDWKDWYHVTVKDIRDAGGAYLLTGYHNSSPSSMIMTSFPQHPWNLFEFRSKVFWNSQLTQNFLNGVASNLRIHSRSAWRTLSTIQLEDFRGGRSLLKHTGSLYESLKLAFPAENWDFLRNIKISKPQNTIVDILTQYISRNLMFVNHKHHALIHKSGTKAELDIWIPTLNLAIEYQGEHHFHQLWERSQNPKIREVRDAEKRDLCMREGIDLVEVPYWWDKSEKQLIGIIRGVRPHFLESIDQLQHIFPIRHNVIPGQGKHDVAWHNGVEFSPLKTIDGWSTSEKLDGIRCHWDGTNVYSRGNHPVHLLEPVAKPLFNHIADGELWYGRGLRLGMGAMQLPELLTFDFFLANTNLVGFSNKNSIE